MYTCMSFNQVSNKKKDPLKIGKIRGKTEKDKLRFFQLMFNTISFLLNLNFKGHSRRVLQQPAHQFQVF